MKIVLVIIFLPVLLTACIGQRGANTSRKVATLDCKVLEKKQRQQLKTAIRHSKSNERSRSTAFKQGHKQNIAKSRMSARAELASITQPTEAIDSAYSPSLTADLAVQSGAANIMKEILHQDHFVTNIKLLAKSSAMPERQAAFVNFENDLLVWPAMLLSGIMGIGVLAVFTKKGKGISRWSKENKFKARSLLVLIKTGTFIGCLAMGDELYNSGFDVPELLSIPTLGVLASAVAFYPSKYFASGAPAFGYLERKIYDASIFAAGAIMMLYAGNRFDVRLQADHQMQAAAYVTLPTKDFGLEKNVISISKKEFRQKIKVLLQDKPKEFTKGTKIALTILAVLAGIVLTFGVASLSCSLACNGSEIASFLVGAGGLGLIAWALVATIRSIHRRPTKKPSPAVKSVA